MQKSIPTSVLAMFAAVALSACGGDGGDSTAPPPPPPPPTSQAAITGSNQDSVAHASVIAGLSISNVQSASSGGGTLATASSAMGRLNALFASGGARRLVASAMAPSARPAAVTTDTQPCAFAGTVTSAFDDKDNNGVLSVGDVITVTFAQCSDVSGSSINGAMTITTTSVTSDTQFAATVAVSHLTAVEGSLTASLDGAMALTEVDSATQSQTTLTVAASGLTAAITSSTYSDTITYGQGFAVDETDDSVQASSTATISGTISAASLGGSVTLATVTPIVAFFDDDFASSGQLAVTGANASKLLMTILDATQVREQLDANGDGVYEGDTTVAWTSLVPS